MPQERISVRTLRAQKNKTPIICLTAYSAPFARILDGHVDVLLVGDSMGMVLYGMPNTLGVTLEMMCNHGKAVTGASTHACVVIDMPFGTYQQSKEQAYENAAYLVAETGCSAVKLEGGVSMQETIRFLVERNIPVMGHVGLMPQSVKSASDYRYQGRTAEERKTILADAKAVEAAGAFSVVLEGIVEPLAQEITRTLSIPTIGIGASATCDGQILVTEDMAGLFSAYTPKFVKRFGNMSEQLEEAAEQYAKEVTNRTFPGKEHTYALKPEKKAEA